MPLSFGYPVQQVTPEIIVEVIECMPAASPQKTIVNKGCHVFSVSSVREDVTAERRTNYDTFIQVIEGAAELKINSKRYKLSLGEGIIVPANVQYRFSTVQGFKMIATVVQDEKYR